MISATRTMLTCHWSARRIQRYLDADPAAPLPPEQVHRLESHLKTCEKCGATAEDYRRLRRALLLFAQRHALDPAVLIRVRVRARAEQLLSQNAG